jgi:hypothetical protein
MCFRRPADPVAVPRTRHHHLRQRRWTPRRQITELLELSGRTQVLSGPSASDESTVAVFGLRLRLLL